MMESVTDKHHDKVKERILVIFFFIENFCTNISTIYLFPWHFFVAKYVFPNTFWGHVIHGFIFRFPNDMNHGFACMV